jgi:hypothetical protein
MQCGLPALNGVRSPHLTTIHADRVLGLGLGLVLGLD